MQIYNSKGKMPKFLRRPSVVEAEQFTDTSNPPRGVQAGSERRADGRLHSYWYVITAQDRLVRVSVGEWIVREPAAAGCFYPIRDQEFRDAYEPFAGKT